MALLHVDRGERQGEIIHLDRDVIILGHSPDCDEIISSLDSVSCWHSNSNSIAASPHTTARYSCAAWS
ncbi:MAG: hypothetical protein EXR98_23610 [Gemmataceae bacterium]|nr:hypothetical protein [Gemmataceae bacterium]